MTENPDPAIKKRINTELFNERAAALVKERLR